MWRRSAGAVIVLAVIYSCSAGRGQSKLKPLPPHFDSRIPEMVPLIVLGQVRERSHAAGPPERSQWTGRWTQLWTVRIRVEAVLQGDLPQEAIEVFFFPNMDFGSFSTAPVIGDLQPGHSELFFLQTDSGKLRTICDGWRSCIMWVRTGSRSISQIVPALTLAERITNLFLSRGDHTTDAQMLDAIYHPEWRWGRRPVYDALERLAKTDKSSQVRAVAEQKARQLLPYLHSQSDEGSAQ